MRPRAVLYAGEEPMKLIDIKSVMQHRMSLWIARVTNKNVHPTMKLLYKNISKQPSTSNLWLNKCIGAKKYDKTSQRRFEMYIQKAPVEIPGR